MWQLQQVLACHLVAVARLALARMSSSQRRGCQQELLVKTLPPPCCRPPARLSAGCEARGVAPGRRGAGVLQLRRHHQALGGQRRRVDLCADSRRWVGWCKWVDMYVGGGWACDWGCGLPAGAERGCRFCLGAKAGPPSGRCTWCPYCQLRRCVLAGCRPGRGCCPRSTLCALCRAWGGPRLHCLGFGVRCRRPAHGVMQRRPHAQSLGVQEGGRWVERGAARGWSLQAGCLPERAG